MLFQLMLSSIISMCVYIGGNDGRYTYVNSSDLRPYHIKSGAQFLMQAVHTTMTHHYNDTLNFLLLSNSTSETIVHVSIMYIHSGIYYTYMYCIHTVEPLSLSGHL